MKPLLSTLILFSSFAAQAQIYEYIDTKGNKTYSDRPPIHETTRINLIRKFSENNTLHPGNISKTSGNEQLSIKGTVVK